MQNDTPVNIYPEDIATKAYVNGLVFESNALTKEIIIDMIYPVGSLYISVSSISPTSLFGFGIWQQITDVFLLAAGNVYNNGDVGGEATHVLTEDEMPSHSHTYKRHAFNNSDTDPETGDDVYGVTNKTLSAHAGSTSAVGGGQAHNNMPPYLAVNVWKRVE